MSKPGAALLFQSRGRPDTILPSEPPAPEPRCRPGAGVLFCGMALGRCVAHAGISELKATIGKGSRCAQARMTTRWRQQRPIFGGSRTCPFLTDVQNPFIPRGF